MELPTSPTNRTFPSTLPLIPPPKKVDNLLIRGESVAKQKNDAISTVGKHSYKQTKDYTKITTSELHPWSARSNNDQDEGNFHNYQLTNSNQQFSFSIEKFEYPTNHNLSVTVSLGQGDSYNIRVSTHDGHGFTKQYDKPKSAASFSDLFSRAGSPLLSNPGTPLSNSLNREGKTSMLSRGQSRMSFRDSIGSSRKISTRGSALSRGGASTTSSRRSRASNELRTMRLLNQLTRSLKSKREAKRELLLSQQEFREMFDLRERISTPLPPIEKPIYNCDVPDWLMPKRHCSHPLFTTFDIKTSKNPIESNAAELSHQRLDRYLWVYESKKDDGEQNNTNNTIMHGDNEFNETMDTQNEGPGVYKKHDYLLNEEYDEIDRIYYDEDGNEIDGMVIDDNKEKNDEKNHYVEEPLDKIEKTPDHYYYPNFFQDKNDIQSDRRKELAKLSFMKHDKILHGMDDLKELLKDVKQRSIKKRRKKRQWRSGRSGWLKK